MRPVFLPVYALWFVIMQAQIALVVKFGVCPLLEAVPEDDHTAARSNLQVQLNMPVSENIIVAMVADPLLVFGEKDQLFLVFSFVRAWIGYLFETALFRPSVTEFVAPSGWQAAETELQKRVAENPAQTHELFYFALYVLWI